MTDSSELDRQRRGPAKLYEWTEPEGYPGHLCLAGQECTIWLEKRPGWCDRGRWLAQLDAWGRLGSTLDWADGWPRYYMHLAIAKSECLEWLQRREDDLRTNSSAGLGPDKNPLCIVCGVHATPLRVHDFYVLLCTRHGLEFVHRMGPVTVAMMQDYAKGSGE